MSDSPTDRAETLERRCRQAVELHLQDFVDAAYELRRLGFPKDATLAWLKWAKVLSRAQYGGANEATIGWAIETIQAWTEDAGRFNDLGMSREDSFTAEVRSWDPYLALDQHRPLLDFLIRELPHIAFRSGAQSWIRGQVGNWIQHCRNLLDPPKPEAPRVGEDPDDRSTYYLGPMCEHCDGGGCTDCNGSGFASMVLLDEQGMPCRLPQGVRCGRVRYICGNCHGQGCKNGCPSNPPQGTFFP